VASKSRLKPYECIAKQDRLDAIDLARCEDSDNQSKRHGIGSVAGLDGPKHGRRASAQVLL
jgi:hypothetical protein